MSVVRKAVTPIDILRNCRGKPVSIELTTGETVNGTVMRTDRAMNIVVKQCIRTGADGETFWKSRECLVRGASVRNVRMDETVLRPTVVPKRAGGGRGGGRGKPPRAAGKPEAKPGSGGAAAHKRPREP